MNIETITNSLCILAIHCLFWPGMILSLLAKPLSKLPTFIRKPLYECMICMSSVWGITFFLVNTGHFNLIAVKNCIAHFSKFEFVFLLPLIIHVLSVCGLNVILDSCIHYWRRGGNRFLKEESKLKG